MIEPNLIPQPAVVPIFVNAGAALVPTLVASVTSLLAILFKPRELLAALRRRPWTAPVVLAAGVALWFGGRSLFFSPAAAQARKTERSAEQIRSEYWTAIALRQLRDEAASASPGGLRPAWEYSPDGGMVLCRPLVVGNRVIIGAAVQDVATFFGVLSCVDAATGAEIWKIDKVGEEDLKPFFSSPTLTPDGKHFVIGQGLHADADCWLLCVNIDTGKIRWKVKTPLHIESTPAVLGDLVVVGAGAIEDNNHKPTGDPGHVMAVRISDGAEVWRHPVNDPESSPAISEEGVAFIGAGFNGNAVVALQTLPPDQLQTKGLSRQLWKTPARFPITGAITVAGDLVLTGGGNGDFVYEDPRPAGVVMALDRKTGAVRWETPADAAVLGELAVAGNVVYCPVRNGSVMALELSTGKVLWKKPLNGTSPLLAGVALHDQTLFAASRDGFLGLFALADGRLIERHPLNAPGKPGKQGLTLSTPRIADGRLFIGSETGGLRCFLLAPAPR